MMTKTQYARSIVHEFCYNCLHKNPSEVTDWGKHIFTSSNLAVALEFLGMLTDMQKVYSSTRAGTVTALIDEENKEISILTVRDMLSLLPD